MNKSCLVLLSWITIIQAMELPHYAVDASGYHYKDESEITDKRTIAILSYGSLVKKSVGPSGVKLHASVFSPTDIFFPISLSRICGNRLTATIDVQQGEPKRVWAATSLYHYLPNARNNLAGREGAAYHGQAQAYDLSSISYMKRLASGRTRDENEELIPDMNRWVIRKQENPRLRLPNDLAKQVATWADAKGYSAVIWVALPPNVNSQQEAIDKLLQNPTFLANTQEYINNLPEGPQTTFENAILAGKEVLQDLKTAAQTPTVPADRDRHYEKFSYYQRGDLPILLTAPHGGEKRIPSIPDREGRDVPMFVTVLDDGTLELALELSDRIHAITGKRPYLVAADFTRKQIDANRPPSGAYETAAAKTYYDFYHNKIAQFIDELRHRYGHNAFLLDLHGQGSDKFTIYRGTRDRQTVQWLIAHKGEQAFTGPHSILGVLAREDNTVYPLNNQRLTAEKSIYSGGYTVGHYGSHNTNGIDALQLESGWGLRREGRPAFVNDLAKAIIEFYNTYLQ
jgi:N-formylglutamate amidohydrolase